jgi:hypothetical protein
MSGLSDNVLWLSWFATSVVKNGVVCVAMVIVVKVGNLFQHSDVLVLLVFFLLFLMNSIAFSFMASTLFSKARTGGLVGMIVWFLLSTPSYGLGKSSVSGTVQVGERAMPCMPTTRLSPPPSFPVFPPPVFIFVFLPWMCVCVCERERGEGGGAEWEGVDKCSLSCLCRMVDWVCLACVCAGAELHLGPPWLQLWRHLAE